MVLTKPSNELAYHDWVVKLSVSVNILLTLFDFMEWFHKNAVLWFTVVLDDILFFSWFTHRYNDGDDYMGEHQDDERDLELSAPIASLSLGRSRDFVFRHASVKRKQTKPVGNTDNIKIELTSGSLLLMNYPTNLHWYHSLPKRKNLPGVRINMTFRVMKGKKGKLSKQWCERFIQTRIILEITPSFLSNSTSN